VAGDNIRIMNKLFPGYVCCLPESQFPGFKVIVESILTFPLPEVVLMFLSFYFCFSLRPLKLENSFNSPSPAGSVLEFCSFSEICEETACSFLDIFFLI
jgi:hypothetical protein